MTNIDSKNGEGNPDEHRYSIMVTIYDNGLPITYASQMLMDDLSGTTVAGTHIYKENDGDFIQFNYSGILEKIILAKGFDTKTKFPITKEPIKRPRV